MKPLYCGIMLSLLGSNLSAMEDGGKRALSFFTTDGFRPTQPHIETELEEENFAALTTRSTFISFNYSLQKYLLNRLKQSSTIAEFNHLATIARQYQHIIARNHLFLRKFLICAIEKEAEELAIVIFSLANNKEILLSPFLMTAARKNSAALFEKILEEYQQIIAERGSPINKTFHTAPDKFKEKLLERFPSYFNQTCTQLFHEALQTYNMKVVTHILKFAHLTIPPEKVDSCFVFAAQQGCLDFFRLEQTQKEKFSLETIIEVLQSATQHNQTKVIKLILNDYQIPITIICDLFLEAVSYNQNEVAYHIHNFIIKFYQSSDLGTRQNWQDYANAIYSKALTDAITNNNLTLIELILEAPFQFNEETLSNLISQAEENHYLYNKRITKLVQQLPLAQKNILSFNSPFLKK